MERRGEAEAEPDRRPAAAEPPATNARERANAARIVAGPSAKGPRPKRGTQGTRKTAAATIAIICRSAKRVMRLQYVPAIA